MYRFDMPSSYEGFQVVGRARMAMEQLAFSGADVLLAGHYHESFSGGTVQRYDLHGFSALVVQAGTATSTRLRESANSFNILRIAPPRIEVEVLQWDPDGNRFKTDQKKVYMRGPGRAFIKLEDQGRPTVS